VTVKVIKHILPEHDCMDTLFDELVESDFAAGSVVRCTCQKVYERRYNEELDVLEWVPEGKDEYAPGGEV
jgi:hypothetical protein